MSYSNIVLLVFQLFLSLSVSFLIVFLLLLLLLTHVLFVFFLHNLFCLTTDSTRPPFVQHGQKKKNKLILQQVFTRPSISYMNVPAWNPHKATKLSQGHIQTERAAFLLDPIIYNCKQKICHRLRVNRLVTACNVG